jgi:hypothetical protein
MQNRRRLARGGAYQTSEIEPNRKMEPMPNKIMSSTEMQKIAIKLHAMADRLGRAPAAALRRIADRLASAGNAKLNRTNKRRAATRRLNA